MKGKVNFYLKEKPDKKGYHVLYAQIYYQNRRIRKDICKLKKTQWNTKSQSFKPGTNKDDIKFISYSQGLIADFRFKVETYFAAIRTMETKPSFEEVRDYLLSEKTSHEKENITLKGAFEEFIGQKSNLNTKKTVRSTYNFLLRFEESTGNSLTYENLTLSYYDKLKEYAYNVEKISNNYFANITKYIKAFLIWSHKREYYFGTLQHNIKKQEKPKTIVSLTENELDLLYKYEFSNPTHSKIRDIFCFGCYTGLRISDLKTLTHNHIINGVIKKRTVKTNENIVVPLTKKALAILERYKDKPLLALPKFEEQYINRQLKDICKIAGIKQPTITLKYIGDKPIEEHSPKYELITMHISRKTFITHCVKLKIPMHILRKMTGHTSDTQLARYYNIDDEQISEEMEKWDG